MEHCTGSPDTRDPTPRMSLEELCVPEKPLSFSGPVLTCWTKTLDPFQPVFNGFRPSLTSSHPLRAKGFPMRYLTPSHIQLPCATLPEWPCGVRQASQKAGRKAIAPSRWTKKSLRGYQGDTRSVSHTTLLNITAPLQNCTTQEAPT